MPLSELTDPAAINAAMNEFDRVGRDSFLRKYGFGPSRAYFVHRGGKYYDSKAIVGAAHGYQYPQKGQLRSEDFSGGEDTVRALLERLGFSVEVRGSDDRPTLAAHDIELIRQSRSRDRYTDFSDEERAAHKCVHEALRRLFQCSFNKGLIFEGRAKIVKAFGGWDEHYMVRFYNKKTGKLDREAYERFIDRDGQKDPDAYITEFNKRAGIAS